MKKLFLTLLNFAFIATLGFQSKNVNAQTGNQNETNTVEKHQISSTFNHKTYELMVSLPKSYTVNNSQRYPVLYVLDGKYSFTSISSVRDMMDLGKELKDIIIVAIEGQNSTQTDWLASRHQDFTPSSMPQADTLWGKMMNIPLHKMKSGGAESFLNTLEKNIIPFVEARYKASDDRGIFGHSLGGLFAGYCLLNKPNLFKRYGINSPSFWWNNSEIVKYEKVFSQSQPALPVKVFLSVGAAEDPMMLSAYNAFTTAFKNRNYKGLKVSSHIFEGETHLSVVPACTSRSLKVLYGATVN